MNVPWDGPLVREGFDEPLDSVIVRVCKVILPRLVFPDWIWKAPIKGYAASFAPRIYHITEFYASVRDLEHSFREMRRFLDVEIEAKRKELELEKGHNSAESRNLFSRIVLASQTEGAAGLSHDDIRGNLFIYLFAGVRSSAPLGLVQSLILRT